MARAAYGEDPPNNKPSKRVIPVAQLEAVAEIGTNTVPVRLYSPIALSEVRRLLEKKAQ